MKYSQTINLRHINYCGMQIKHNNYSCYRFNSFFTLLILLGIFCFSNNLQGQVFWQDDFGGTTPEMGGGTRLSSVGNPTDGIFCDSDRFVRADNIADGSCIGCNTTWSNASGTWVWGGEDLDGTAPCSNQIQTITWSGIDITGRTTLEFIGLFGIRNGTSWEADDELKIEYRIDGGALESGFCFSPEFFVLGLDADCDETVDGSLLSTTLTEHTFSITGTGTSIELIFTANVNGGGEEFVVDNFRLNEGTASISFTAPADLCIDAGNQTGLSGGTPAGGVYSGSGVTDNSGTYSFNPTTAGVGTHTITYTQGGNSAMDDIEVFALDDASYSYSSGSYCVNDSDPTPTITGLAGGTFSAGSGLIINASTGTIDLSASTPNIYTVTYATAGTCPNSSDFTVIVDALDDASYSYSSGSYCVNDSDPTPTITGLAGGTFSAGGGLSIDHITGTIDLSASTPGSYTVTYDTPGSSCTNSSSVAIEIEGDCSCDTGNNIYTGTDGDWFNSSNWSEGCYPSSPYTGDITITSGTLDNTGLGDFIVNGNVVIGAAAVFTIVNGNTLTVNGDFTNNGTTNW